MTEIKRKNQAVTYVEPITKSGLDRYEEAVEMLAKTRSEYVFQNQDAAHADVVIKKMLEHSDKEIVIYDDDLSGDVADQSQELLETISDVIRKQGKSILFAVRNRDEKHDSRVVALLRELNKLFPEKVRIKIASDEFIDAVNAVRKEVGVTEYINFAAADSNSFRLEFPAGERKAFCSFNDSFYTPKLLSVFKTKFDGCEDYFNEQ